MFLNLGVVTLHLILRQSFETETFKHFYVYLINQAGLKYRVNSI